MHLIYVYKTDTCVRLFVAILLPNYWTDPDQTWHEPWECPPHTFWGGTPTRESIILEKLNILETFS